MAFRAMIIILMLLNVSVDSSPLYKINLQDKKVFEITSDSKDYDEESENEMVQPADLASVKLYGEDESGYRPLHSFVASYNERESLNKMQLINLLAARLAPIVWEKPSTDRIDEPFVAGFREDLDKVFND